MRRTCIRFILAACTLLLAALANRAPAHAAGHPSFAAAPAEPAVITLVISEVHYDPSPVTSALEFVELYNPGAQAVRLAGWRLEGGIDYVFADDAVVAPFGTLVVALEPAVLRAAYGVSAVGPFQGRLSNDGDRLVLRNERAQEIDLVEYGVGFPWPVVGYVAEQSISLINSAADNSIGGAWRATRPTPGAANAEQTSNPPPFVSLVEHQPTSPRGIDAVTIRARATDGDGVAGLTLHVQVVRPGEYIRITDATYNSAWTSFAMQPAGDDLYTFTLPADMVQNRRLLRYRIEAADRGGRRVTVPDADDPQPNFALYVYDGAPVWPAAINPQGAPLPISDVRFYNFARMRALPTYHLIANNADVVDAQFIPNSGRFEGYMGTEYLWRGTLVYDGVVYDHVGFRARGQVYRYASGKNKWKLNFLPGHRFQAKDNFGRPYPVKWDKLNLASGMQHANRGYRGEHGMFEALTARVFAMAGVPSPSTHFVQFRVVDQSYDYGSSQYEGDFWGLYMAVEELDGRFLRTRALPDGNLYEMNAWDGELQNQGYGQPGDKSDLHGFMGAYSYANLDDAWWRSNFDLDGYYRFRAALEASHHYDVNEGKNYFYFRNPNTGLWSIWPWDLDLTWAATFSGDGREPFRDLVLSRPAFAVEYQNAVRELRDLIFNPEQMNLLIDEMASTIDTSSNGLSMVDADRAMWDYNPILRSRYIDTERARWGKFYLQSPTQDFAGMVEVMKGWVITRTAWMDFMLLTDRDLPDTPSLRYTGSSGFPADDLTFAPSAFSDPQGAGSFGGIQWMAAQVAWPGLAGYVAGTPNRYEKENAWTSPVLGAYTSSYTLPAGVCAPGTTCRVRVRMKDNSGRWSHWSAPQHFVVGMPVKSISSALKITEIMYHPRDWGNVPGDSLEFVELKNIGAVALDLSNMRLANAVTYTFPVGSRLEPGAFAVLAEDADRFRARYGLAAQGQFSGQLSNGGETLDLLDAFGRTIATIAYEDRGGWPTYADGLGYSLTPVNPDGAVNPNQPEAWRASQVIGGSPGADDPAPIVLNEFVYDSVTKQLTAIELFNPTAHAVNLSGWVLTDRWRGTAVYARQPVSLSQVAGGTVIAANGYLVIPLTQLAGGASFDRNPVTVALASVSRAGWLTAYVNAVDVVAPAYTGSLGRYVARDGAVAYVPQASTPGAANGGPVTGPIAITKVQMISTGAGGLRWIELTNRGDQPVALYDPSNPVLALTLDIPTFQVAPGLTLDAHTRLLVANTQPYTVCASGVAPAGWRVTGVMPQQPASAGGEMRLLLPRQAADGAVAYLLADVIRYDGADRLQVTPGATYWQRSADDAPGTERTSWTASSAPLAATEGVTSTNTVCTFDAYRSSGRTQVEWVVRDPSPALRFAVWRAATLDRSAATLVAADVAPASASNPGAYRLVDDSAPSDVRPYYWLQAITDDGAADIAVTGLRQPAGVNYMPLVASQ